MKSWSIILTIAFLLFLTSSHSTEPTEARIGEYAPLFSIKNETSNLNLQEMRGKYVLLSFWSLTDAQSRIENTKYSSFSKSIDNSKLELISINIDSDRTLWKQIIEIDNLDAKSQYSSMDIVKGNIFDDYYLETGNRAFLINPNGKIEAVNPSVNQLVRLN